MSGIVDSVGLKVCYTRASPCFWSFTLLPGPYPAGVSPVVLKLPTMQTHVGWAKLRLDAGSAWIHHGSSMDASWTQALGAALNFIC